MRPTHVRKVRPIERASKWLALLSVGALLAGVAATPAAAAPATEDYVILTKKAGFSAQSGASIAQIQGQFERETRELTAAQAESLRGEDGVLAVLPDITTSWIGPETLSASASTSTVGSWGLDRIDQRSKTLDKKFNTSTFSGTKTIAVVIDSGVSPSTQFGGRLLQGYGWDYVDGDSDTTDCNGHGTHVAGTIASTGYGVATSASVLPLRVLDCEGNGSPESLYLALTDLLTWYQEQPKLAGRVVVNMSLGGYVSVVGDLHSPDLANLDPEIRDEAIRFAREAVPVTLVPTEAWETWKSATRDLDYTPDCELIDAVDSLAQEVAR